MGFLAAIKAFDKLRKQKVFDDYVIGGAVAVNFYIEPRGTKDLDLYFMVDDEGYHLIWDTLTQMGYHSEGQKIVVEGVPVDIFPTSIGQIFEEAFLKARRTKVNNISVKIFTPEYLIATKLMSFRGRDKGDIYELVESGKVDMNLLADILRRYSNEQNPIYKRFKSLFR